MAKTIVRLDITKWLPKVADEKTANQLDKKITPLVKKFMGKGISPVKFGGGKFEPYTNPAKYPGNIKGKSKTPVNLKLSRDFWDSLGFKKQGKKIIFGVLKGRKNKVGKYAGHHNTGTNKMPARPWLPGGGRNTFIESIQKEIRQIVSKRIDKLIKKSSR